MDVLTFCINTIPDIDGARRLYDLHGLSDEDVAKAILQKRRQQADTEFLPHHLQKIVAISVVISRTGQFKVWSLGDETSGEQDLLLRFYAGLERYTPRPVSWNGQGFDLPVIQYRSLLYPLNAHDYWNTENHERHIDLSDVLAVHQQKTTVLQDELARLCGFPGARGVPGFDVWQHWLNDDVRAIREHGETRVLNTYLLYLNWERNRGHIIPEQYDQQCSLVREALKKSEQTHLVDFENNWMEQ